MKYLFWVSKFSFDSVRSRFRLFTASDVDIFLDLKPTDRHTKNVKHKIILFYLFLSWVILTFRRLPQCVEIRTHVSPQTPKRHVTQWLTEVHLHMSIALQWTIEKESFLECIEIACLSLTFDFFSFHFAWNNYRYANLIARVKVIERKDMMFMQAIPHEK